VRTINAAAHEGDTGHRIVVRIALLLVAAAVAFVHSWALYTAAAHGSSSGVLFLILAIPGIALCSAIPRRAHVTGYRSLAIWLIVLFSSFPLPAIIACDTWLIYRTWMESGRTFRLAPAIRAAFRRQQL